MSHRQFTTPLLVKDGTSRPLHRVPFGERSYDEAWLQELLFEHPALIPAAEFEPVFDELIALARELPTPAGPIDLVYVTAQGFITLVETKLWRNPEARRSVVAQIIDYTKEISRWSYQQLSDAVTKARCRAGLEVEGDPLIRLVEKNTDGFDEATFVDNVSRNLHLGRFLLLIVGDGIREDVEHMADFLQQTPQLGFTLGLVEMGLYRLDPNEREPLFVQPRIMARTQEVTRAVVEIKVPLSPSDISVTTPVDVGTDPVRRARMTEELFLEQLGKATSPEVVDLAKWALNHAGEHDLEIEWGDAGPLLKYVDDAIGKITFSQLKKDGRLGLGRGNPYVMCQELGLPIEIAQDYLDDLVALIPGACRKSFTTSKGNSRDLLVFGENPGVTDWPPLAPLVPHRERWFAAIDRAIDRIQEARAEP